MDDADILPIGINYAINNNNYDMIHILESKMKEEFQKNSLLKSISGWNEEMIEYSLENFNHDYLTKRNVPFEKVDEIFSIFGETFYSSNYKFFESTLLPFISKNEKFVSENIHRIVDMSFLDQSGFFAIELLKHHSIDVNYHFDDINGSSLLMKAVQYKNDKIIELLVKDPKLDINQFAFNSMNIFQIACRSNINVKAFELICSHPKIDINSTNDRVGFAGYKFLAPNGNFLQLSYLISKFAQKLNFDDFQEILFQCCKRRHLIGAKVILNYIFRLHRKDYSMKNTKPKTKKGILNDFVLKFTFRPDYKIEYREELKQIMDELHIGLNEFVNVLCQPVKKKTVIVKLITTRHKKYQIEIDPDSTIEDLKKMIIKAIKSDDNIDIKMVYKAKILKNDVTISSLELDEKHFIIVYSKNVQLLDNLPFPQQIPNRQANRLPDDEIQRRINSLLDQFTKEEQEIINRLVALTNICLYKVLQFVQICDRNEELTKEILFSYSLNSVFQTNTIDQSVFDLVF